MLRIIGATDKGMERHINEDRYAGEVFSRSFAYGVVCDGLGGENAGSVASSLASEEIRRMLETSYRPGLEARSVHMILESAIATANAVVFDQAARDPAAMRGMGTTVCLAVVSEDTVCLANVGDSRGYLLRDGKLHRLTEDHTQAQMLYRQGQISREELERHPDRNKLTRAVGVSRAVTADYTEYQLEPGDVLLLCSDGLYGMLDPVTLRECIHQSISQGDARCLIDAANSRGGRDNITAVIIWDEEDENG